MFDDAVRFVDVAEGAIAQTAHGRIIFFAGDIIVRLVEQFQGAVIAAAWPMWASTGGWSFKFLPSSIEARLISPMALSISATA